MSGWAITPAGAYPPDWLATATGVKDVAGWRCIRCDAPHSREGWTILTVHHLNGDKSDCRWWNLLALCQRCHLRIQGKVNPDRPWVMTEHTPWFRPYVAGFYAAKYLGLELTREETMARLDELLELERAAVFARDPARPGRRGGPMSVQGLTCQEAGKIGGLATYARHGAAHFRRIGAVRNGRRGYLAQRASLGESGMEAKARAGGEALLATRGIEWYRALGRLGAAVRAANRARRVSA